jgi:UDP-N-acetylmuramoyl-tripeptide--D-alanyl-D-alanine ligase
LFFIDFILEVLMLTLADIIDAIKGVRPTWANLAVTEAVIDSRDSTPGSLFIALPGENVDGHEFVQDAFNRGAHFAFVDRDLPDDVSILDLRSDVDIDMELAEKLPIVLRVEDCLEALQAAAKFWRTKHDLRVIGITGSVGKSTTKEVAASVLEQRYETLKNPGNLNNEIGLPLTLLNLRSDHQRAVLEMGFYVPGEIKFLCDIAQPQVGVITNIGTVHAERAGSQEAIAKGKAELVEALPDDPKGVAILNYDDPLVRDMVKKTRAQVFFYGMDERAHLWADQVDGLGLEGISFRLHYRNEILHLRVPMIGRHSVHTALRAAAVGLVEGLTWHEIVSGLRSSRVQLRLVAVQAKNGALLLDDTYNASPQSTLAALNLLDEMSGYKVAVLGDMLELGRYEEIGHQIVGVRASEVADEIVTVGERARMIASSARKRRFSKLTITEFDNTEQVIDYLKDRLNENDVVLVKGSRGMMMDRIVAELEAPR